MDDQTPAQTTDQVLKMSFPSPEPPDQPATGPIRKARPTVRGLKLTEDEIAAAFAKTAAQYGPILKLKDAAAIVGVAAGTLKRWTSEGRFGAGDWKAYALQSCGLNPKLDAALQVLRDPALKTLDQRVAKFHDLSGGSKPTFCRYQQQIRDLHPELAKGLNGDGELAGLAIEKD